MTAQPTSKPRGRPRKPDTEARTCTVEVTLTQAEYDSLAGVAKGLGLSMAAYLRGCARLAPAKP